MPLEKYSKIHWSCIRVHLDCKHKPLPLPLHDIVFRWHVHHKTSPAKKSCSSHLKPQSLPVKCQISCSSAFTHWADAQNRTYQRSGRNGKSSWAELQIHTQQKQNQMWCIHYVLQCIHVKFFVEINPTKIWKSLCSFYIVLLLFVCFLLLLSSVLLLLLS